MILKNRLTGLAKSAGETLGEKMSDLVKQHTEIEIRYTIEQVSEIVEVHKSTLEGRI